jgi:FMN phosphatase YigB (HAD superfamily)
MPRGKKKDQKPQPPHPDYENLALTDTEEEIKKYKTMISEKNSYRLQVKGEKKEANGAFNEQLKEIEEDLEFFDGVLKALKDRKRRLEVAANGPAEVQTMVVPVPPA